MTTGGHDFYALVDIPNFDGPLLATRSQQLAVVAHSQAIDVQGMTGKGFDLFATLGAPHFHDSIMPCCKQVLAILAENQGENLVGVSGPFLELRAARGIPDFHHAASAARGQAASIRTESNAGRFQLVIELDLAFVQIPNFDLLIGIGGQLITAGMDCDSPNRQPMAGESKDDLAGFQVPDLDGLVGAARYQALAIVAESHTVNRVATVLERNNFLSGVSVPDFDQTFEPCRGQQSAVRTV